MLRKMIKVRVHSFQIIDDAALALLPPSGSQNIISIWQKITKDNLAKNTVRDIKGHN